MTCDSDQEPCCSLVTQPEERLTKDDTTAEQCGRQVTCKDMTSVEVEHGTDASNEACDLAVTVRILIGAPGRRRHHGGGMR